MGDSASAIHYLNLAQEARENIVSSDVLDGLFFSEAKQTYYSGSSLQWLPGDRNAKAAEAESARAIHMFQEASPDDPSGDELLAHIYLGNSRLTLGEIEGSMEALRPVLDLPSAERNAWQRKRMQQLALRLKSGSLSDSRLRAAASPRRAPRRGPAHRVHRRGLDHARAAAPRRPANAGRGRRAPLPPRPGPLGASGRRGKRLPAPACPRNLVRTIGRGVDGRR